MRFNIPTGLRQTVAWLTTVVAAYGIVPLQSSAQVTLGVAALGIWGLYFTESE